VTRLRQIMLEELRRRNYAESTIHAYIHTVEHFSRHFHRSPDQLGPEHIRQYQAALFTRWKLAPNTGSCGEKIDILWDFANCRRKTAAK
jgi:integrase/recombinase XerD